MRPRNLPAAACCLLLAACPGALEPGSVAPMDIADPTIIARTGASNDWLICPSGVCAAAPSATAPAFAVTPNQLFGAWRAVVAAQPRATVIAMDELRLLLLVQDRTPIMRFVDTVTIRILSTPAGGSTFAAYSKSNLGAYDFGTNRRRLEAWTADLVRRSPAAS